MQPGRRTVQGELERALARLSAMAGRVGSRRPDERTLESTPRAGDRLHLARAAWQREELGGRCRRCCRRTSVSVRCAGWRPTSGRDIGRKRREYRYSDLERAAQPAARALCARRTRAARRRRQWPGRRGARRPARLLRLRRQGSTAGADGAADRGPSHRVALVTVDVVGDAFLRQMVRRIVAALLRVGARAGDRGGCGGSAGQPTKPAFAGETAAAKRTVLWRG